MKHGMGIGGRRGMGGHHKTVGATGDIRGQGSLWDGVRAEAGETSR